MPVIKPKGDWRDEESGAYSGPMPKAGPYRGVVDGMWYTTIKKGANEGEDQYVVSVKINEGPYKGFRTLHNLPQLKQNAWSTNQFLYAMTDGSDKQKEALKNWFYDNGVDVAPDTDAEKLGIPVRKIISPKGPNAKGFEPVGKPIGFILKKDSYDGKDRMIVDRFIVGLEDVEPEEDSASEDGLGEFAPETTHNPEPAAAEQAEEETAPSETDSDDDDPWS
jgi:hypothetical protein